MAGSILRKHHFSYHEFQAISKANEFKRKGAGCVFTILFYLYFKLSEILHMFFFIYGLLISSEPFQFPITMAIGQKKTRPRMILAREREEDSLGDA